MKSRKANIDSSGTSSLFLEKKDVLLGHFGTSTQSCIPTKGGMKELVGKSSLMSTLSPPGCSESLAFHSFSGPAGSHPPPLSLGPSSAGVQKRGGALSFPRPRGRGWLRSWVCAPTPGRLGHAGSSVNQVQPAQQRAFYFLN